MSVTNSYSPGSYTGNGVATVYAYGYKIADEDDLLVKVAGVTKTITTDYTVSGVDSETGGNVTFVVAPTNGAPVTIERNVGYTRPTDYQRNGAFEEATVDDDFDRVAMQVQQLDDRMKRSAVLTLPLSGVATPIVLPAPGAGKFLRWNVGGTALETIAASPDDDTFTQSGAGAVARSWTSKVAEVVSIKDFGAVADATLVAGVIGGTDNRAAIQATIDSLPTGGGIVFCPKGKFRIAGTGLFIDTEHVKLVGEGMAADEAAGTGLLGSSMLCYSGTGNAINVATQGGAGWPFGNTLAGVELRDFALIGTASATGGIVWGTSSFTVFPLRAVMNNVSIFNFAGAGVSGLKINYLVTGLFERVYAYNNTDGIRVTGGTTMHFRHINTRVNGRYGMVLTNSVNSLTDVTVDGHSIIEGNQDAGMLVLTEGTVNGTIALRDVHFENNCVAAGTYQCLVGPASGSSVTANFIMDACRFATTVQTGDLSIDYVTQAKIANTTFAGAGGKIPLKLVSANAAGVVIDTCQTAQGTIDPDGRAVAVLNTKGTSSAAAKLPIILAKSAIPFIGLSSGSVSAPGAISAITALPFAYAHAYCWFPANSLSASHAAGWFYCTFSTTTAGTAYLNTYTSGIPTIPTSPTAVTAGQSAFVGNTATEETGPTITVPANAMGASGMLRISSGWSLSNTANAKTLRHRFSGAGGTSFMGGSSSSTGGAYAITQIQNRGQTNKQIGWQLGSGGTATAGPNTVPAQATVDTTAATSVVIAQQRNTATDNCVIESWSIELTHGD